MERTLSHRALLSLSLALFGVLLAPLCCSLAAVALGRSACRRIAADPRQRGSRLVGTEVLLGVLGLLFWTPAWIAYLSPDPAAASHRPLQRSLASSAGQSAERGGRQ